ncbi:flagellar hook-length control protein FliK [Chromobacterium amazonense]|uniref:flagellar hook-length control protein FliK n=1 Tax=Chromobacterium amazonense TaxID=1382803 RepID=UPI0031F6C26B
MSTTTMNINGILPQGKLKANTNDIATNDSSNGDVITDEANSFLALLNEAVPDVIEDEVPDTENTILEGFETANVKNNFSNTIFEKFLANYSLPESKLNLNLPEVELRRDITNYVNMPAVSLPFEDVTVRPSAQEKITTLDVKLPKPDISQATRQTINLSNVAELVENNVITRFSHFNSIEGSQSNPVVSKVEKALPMWVNDLQKSIGERLQVQLQDGVRHAVIRLDPPHMGTLQILIKEHSGAPQVYLLASNEEVVKQLNMIADSIRDELSQRQNSEAQVFVRHATAQGSGDGQSSGKKQKQSEGQQPYNALLEESEESADVFLSEFKRSMKL